MISEQNYICLLLFFFQPKELVQKIDQMIEARQNQITQLFEARQNQFTQLFEASQNQFTELFKFQVIYFIIWQHLLLLTHYIGFLCL